MCDRYADSTLAYQGYGHQNDLDQIKNLKLNLGHGRMNLTIKIGNTPQEKVLKTMHHLRDIVFPAVREV